MEPEFGPAQTAFGPMSESAKRGPAAGGLGGGGGGHHRRSFSDNSFRLPDDDDVLFDDIDFSDVDFRALAVSDPPPAPPPDSSAAAAPAPGRFPPRGAHLRSLSVDAAFFEGLELSVPATPPERAAGGREKEAAGHRRSGSVDGMLEADLASALDFTKKAMPADKLAELAMIDPKRAKRILANRQSAARSKERKIRYTGELERKVQTLQTEATTLSAQLTRLQRDTNDLNAENKELKLRLQAMEQQARLRDALNDTLRDEVQRLRIATGQISPFNDSFNKGLQPSAFFTSSQARHQLGNQQHYVSQTPPNGQSISGQSSSGSMDFTSSPNNVT